MNVCAVRFLAQLLGHDKLATDAIVLALPRDFAATNGLPHEPLNDLRFNLDKAWAKATNFAECKHCGCLYREG